MSPGELTRSDRRRLRRAHKKRGAEEGANKDRDVIRDRRVLRAPQGKASGPGKSAQFFAALQRSEGVKGPRDSAPAVPAHKYKL